MRTRGRAFAHKDIQSDKKCQPINMGLIINDINHYIKLSSFTLYKLIKCLEVVILTMSSTIN